MTEPLRARRPRRRSGDASLPAEVAAFFARESNDAPWALLLSPGYELRWEFWKIWARGRRGVRPPAGWESVAARPPERLHGLPYAQAVQIAWQRLRRWERFR
jgi:hypothetical protein